MGRVILLARKETNVWGQEQEENEIVGHTRVTFSPMKLREGRAFESFMTNRFLSRDYWW